MLERGTTLARSMFSFGLVRGDAVASVLVLFAALFAVMRIFLFGGFRVVVLKSPLSSPLAGTDGVGLLVTQRMYSCSSDPSLVPVCAL